MVTHKRPAWGFAQWAAMHAWIALLIGLISAAISLALSRGRKRTTRLSLAALCVAGGPLGALLPLLLPHDGDVRCSKCRRFRPLGPQPCAGCDSQLSGYTKSDSSILDDAFMPGAH